MTFIEIDNNHDYLGVYIMDGYSLDLMDDLAVGVAVVESIEGEDRIVYANEMFTEITGFNLEDVPTVEKWYKKAYPDPEIREKQRENLVNIWKTNILMTHI